MIDVMIGNPRKSTPPAPPGLRRELSRALGECIIDGIGEAEVIRHLAAIPAAPVERAAALSRWRSYATGVLTL